MPNQDQPLKQVPLLRSQFLNRVLNKDLHLYLFLCQLYGQTPLRLLPIPKLICKGFWESAWARKDLSTMSLVKASSRLGSLTCIPGNHTSTVSTSVSNVKIILKQPEPQKQTVPRLQLPSSVGLSATAGLSTKSAIRPRATSLPLEQNSRLSYERTSANQDLLSTASRVNSGGTPSISW